MTIIKDKRGLEFRLAFYATILVSIVIVAVGVHVGEWEDAYDSGLSYDLTEYDNLDSLSTEAESQKDSIAVKSSNTGEDFEGTSIRGVFGLLNNIYQPFRVVFGNNGMIDKLTERWGIPDYIRQAVVTVMVMAITFGLLAIFYRRPERSV